MTLRTRRLLFYFLVLVFIGASASAIFYSNGWRIDLETRQINKLGALYFDITPANAKISIDKRNLEFKGGFLRSGVLVANLFPKTYTVTITKEGHQTWVKELEVKPSLITEAPPVVLLREAHNFALVAEEVKNFWINGGTVIVQDNNDNLFYEKTRIVGNEVVAWSQDKKSIITKERNNYYLLQLNKPRSALNLALAYKNATGRKAPIRTILPFSGTDDAFVISDANGLSILELGTLSFVPVTEQQVDAFAVAGNDLLYSIGKNLVTYNQSTGREETFDAEFINSLEELKVSPSGFYIAARDRKGNIMLLNRKTREIHQITDRAKETLFSPNSNSLAIVHEDGTLTVHPIGDEQKRIKNGVSKIATFSLGAISPDALAWHKNSAYLFVKYPSSLYFLETSNLPPRNFQVVDMDVLKYAYNAEENSVYLLKQDALYKIVLE